MYTYHTYEKYGIKLLTFDRFNEVGGIKHCFTTRYGGVSVGPCESLNFSRSRDIEPENVYENAARLAECLNVDYNKLTAVPQVHGGRVKVITEENCGAGFSKDSFDEGFDAMITNVPAVPLMTLHGDCVPVFLYDPIAKAVGMVHSGWRSTKERIAKNAVDAMKQNYGCRAENIIAAVGPAICLECFEVDMPVYEELLSVFPVMEDREELKKQGRSVLSEDGVGFKQKMHVSLSGLVKTALLESGIKEENISMSNICTCCEENAEDYFSHRRTKGQTGIMAGVICLE